MSQVWLGVDHGTARIGLAVSDRDGVLAVPLRTLATDKEAPSRVASVVTEAAASLVVVGLPRSLSGGENPATTKVRSFATKLAGRVSVPVRLVDERLTTVSATRALHEAGRTSKRHRDVIDQAAAVELLQAALDQHRNTGQAVGELVPPPASNPLGSVG